MGWQKMMQNTRRGGHPPIGWLGVAAGVCVGLTAFHAHGAQWTTTSGTWSNTANWSGGTLPNGANTDARLYGAGGTITVDGDGMTNSNYALTYLYNQSQYGSYVLNSGTLRFLASSGTAVGSWFPHLGAGTGTTITLNTAITGSDGLLLFPLTWPLAGTMAFGNSLNSYTGPTRLGKGTLRAEAADVLGGASSDSQLQIISTTGIFNLNGFNQRVGSLASSGRSQVGGAITSITGGLITSASAATLTIGSDNLNATYTGTLAGGISLTKIGSGTQTLSGSSTFSGVTTIQDGTLKLASGGSLANSPTIIVGDAASIGAVFDLTDKTSFSIGGSQTLMGKGTVLLGETTALTINGLLSPGNSPGLLTYDGGGTVTLSGTTLMEVWGTSRGVDPGYDAIDLVNSTDLTFGGVLNLDFSQTFAGGTTFNLFTPDGTSSLAGNFSSISMVGSAYGDLTFTNDAGVWTTNTGAANQSMTFNSATGTLIIAVPEPGTAVFAAVGMALAGWSLRKRRRGTA